MDQCWTTIGVRGDGSCPELRQYVHCRNCPVYSAGAAQLLNVDAPAGYVAEWTNHVAQPKPSAASITQSAVVFRVGSEWLALPTARVTEVANRRPIHTLPHRSRDVILGLVSVRGELVICVSLGNLLGLQPPAAVTGRMARVAHPRLLLIRREKVRAVCPVDEVHGIHRFSPEELKEVPSTVARATATYSRALLSWEGQSVGLLDDELLFQSLKRSVA